MTTTLTLWERVGRSLRLDFEYDAASPGWLNLKEDVLKDIEEFGLDVVDPKATVYWEWKARKDTVEATVYLLVTPESYDKYWDELREGL